MTDVMGRTLNLLGLHSKHASLTEVRKSLRATEQRAEAKIGDAEAELNDIRKIRGWIDIQIEETVAAIRAKEEEQQER